MGKASSAKKVARAARAGGKSSARERPKLGFPLAIFVILVLGTLVVAFSRDARVNNKEAAAAPSSKNADHWHAAYGIYICDKFEAPLNDATDKDPLGIHTHGEGVMHIHPFVSAASGTNARLKLWGQQVGMTFYDDGFKLPNGTEYRKGTAKCGDKPAKVEIYRWADEVQNPGTPVDVFESGFPNINYVRDRDAYTIAVLPEDFQGAPPKPDSVAELDRLTDVPSSQQTPQLPTDPSGQVSIPSDLSIPGDPTASIPLDPSASIPGDPTASIPVDPAVSTPAPSTPAS